MVFSCDPWLLHLILSGVLNQSMVQTELGRQHSKKRKHGTRSLIECEHIHVSRGEKGDW